VSDYMSVLFEKMKTRLLIFTLSIFLGVPARAELKWEQNTTNCTPRLVTKHRRSF